MISCQHNARTFSEASNVEGQFETKRCCSQGTEIKACDTLRVFVRPIKCKTDPKYICRRAFAVQYLSYRFSCYTDRPPRICVPKPSNRTSGQPVPRVFTSPKLREAMKSKLRMTLRFEVLTLYTHVQLRATLRLNGWNANGKERKETLAERVQKMRLGIGPAAKRPLLYLRRVYLRRALS